MRVATAVIGPSQTVARAQPMPRHSRDARAAQAREPLPRNTVLAYRGRKEIQKEAYTERQARGSLVRTGRLQQRQRRAAAAAGPAASRGAAAAARRAASAARGARGIGARTVCACGPWARLVTTVHTIEPGSAYTLLLA
jgi:hypothetical protein